MLLVAVAFDGVGTGVVSAALVNQLTVNPLTPPVIGALSVVKSTVAIPDPATPSQTACVWFVTTGLGFTINGTALEVTGHAPPDVTIH